MTEKEPIKNEFEYDRLVWKASDYFARLWNIERNKPLVNLVNDTRGYLERSFEIPKRTGAALLEPADEQVLGLDENELNFLQQRLDSGRRNFEKEIDIQNFRLSNVVRKEIHDCLGIWLTVFKPNEKLQMTLSELKEQAEKMKVKDPFMLFHSLHRQRRERIRVEASWVDKRDAVNLIIDPVAATESKGQILSVVSDEWDQPYPTELELYADWDRGLVNIFSLNNHTMIHFDEAIPVVEKKLTDLGFVADREGVFVKGALRIRLTKEGRIQTTTSVHVNEHALNQVLDERFDLVLRATDITNATSYGLVAAEMRNGLMNSKMLPDFVALLDGIKDEIPFAINHKLGSQSFAISNKPAATTK